MAEGSVAERFVPACEECPFTDPEISVPEACKPTEAELQVPEIAVAVAPCLLRRLVQTEENLARTDEALDDAKEQAHHDGLTGLYNYRGFRIALANLGKQARRREDASILNKINEGAIIFGDVADFKAANDATTHDTADEGLKKIANIIAKMVRVGDPVCRRSGDEFIAFIAGEIDDVQVVYDRIQNRLLKGVKIRYRGIEYKLFIRLAMVYKNDIVGFGDVYEMIQEADAAVNNQRRKEIGGSRAPRVK